MNKIIKHILNIHFYKDRFINRTYIYFDIKGTDFIFFDI